MIKDGKSIPGEESERMITHKSGGNALQIEKKLNL